MTQENELTYEEAIVLLALRAQDAWMGDTMERARKSVASATVEIRAALARGPQGKAGKPDDATCQTCGGEGRIEHGFPAWSVHTECARLREIARQHESRALTAEAKLTDAALVEADNSAWLIEFGQQMYMRAGNGKRPLFCWTFNVNEALRFRDKKEADQVLLAVRDLVPDLFPSSIPLPARPTEHIWLSRRAAQPRQPKE